MHTQMQYWKSQGDELGGSGKGHYVITAWWSQRGIKMFQTNTTVMHSAGVMHCTVVFVCFLVLLSKWAIVTGECEWVFGCVCCVCARTGSSQSLWFQSVIVSRDCGAVSVAPLFSVSPPSPGSSSTPAPCSRHRAGFPKQLEASSSYSLCFSPSLFLCLSGVLIPCRTKAEKIETGPNYYIHKY